MSTDLPGLPGIAPVTHRPRTSPRGEGQVVESGRDMDLEYSRSVSPASWEGGGVTAAPRSPLVQEQRGRQ